MRVTFTTEQATGDWPLASAAEGEVAPSFEERLLHVFGSSVSYRTAARLLGFHRPRDLREWLAASFAARLHLCGDRIGTRSIARYLQRLADSAKPEAWEAPM